MRSRNATAREAREVWAVRCAKGQPGDDLTGSALVAALAPQRVVVLARRAYTAPFDARDCFIISKIVDGFSGGRR